MISETVRRGSLRRMARRSEGAAKLLSRDSDGTGGKASTDKPMHSYRLGACQRGGAVGEMSPIGLQASRPLTSPSS